MDTLRDTKFSEVIYYEADKILEQFWKHKTIAKEDWKQEMLAFVNLSGQVSANRTLVNAVNFDFPIIPELQEWTMEHVLGPLTARNNALAFVVSEDVFAQFSIESTMEMTKGADIRIQFFDNYNEAYQWLQEH